MYLAKPSLQIVFTISCRDDDCFVHVHINRDRSGTLTKWSKYIKCTKWPNSREIMASGRILLFLGIGRRRFIMEMNAGCSRLPSSSAPTYRTAEHLFLYCLPQVEDI